LRRGTLWRTVTYVDKPARRRLEEVWRERVEAARADYRLALAQWRQVQSELRTHPPPGERPSLPQALRREIRARAKYVRVLRTFTRLILHGEIPKAENG